MPITNPTRITIAHYLDDPKVNTLTKGIVQQMREESPLLNMLQFHSENRLKFFNYRGPRTLEGGTWKNLGEPFDEGIQWDYDRIEETTYRLGIKFKIDEELENVADDTIVDPVKSNLEYYTRGIHRQIMDSFLNGKSSDNSGKSFTGLRERLAKLPATQTIQANTTTDPLDLRTSASDYAQTVEEFIVLMNKLMKAVDGGRPDFFIVNEDFQIKFESILRTSGLLTYAKDNMEREFPTFKGIPFIDIGRKNDDTTYILTNNETVTGSDGTVGTDHCTSIYAVKQGPEYLTMLEKHPLRVRDNNFDPDMINHTYIIDWVLGMMITHPRSVARLQGLRLA